ncbi:MAG: DUF6326 family protein [Acidimicrobiales bacterium]
MTRVAPQGRGPELLSTIWIYVLLSTLLRDVHEIFRGGFIAELASQGTVNGTEVTETTLLVAGLVLQLPLAMVVASRVLPRQMNRVANIVAAVVLALGLLGIWPKDADDIVFGLFQLVGLAGIVVICYRWQPDDRDTDTIGPPPTAANAPV